MEAVEPPQTEEDRSQSVEELHLLLDWGQPGDLERSRRAGILSVTVHVLAIGSLLLVPREVFREVETRRVTPLIAPPTELTQKAPNHGKISKEFNVESLRPRPRLVAPPSPPPAMRAPAAALAVPASKPAAPVAIPEPPKIETASKGPGPKLPETLAQAAPPPPQIQTEERPKLAFETPGGGDSGKGQGPGKLATPTGSVSEAMRNLARSGGGGGLVVGDVGGGSGGIGELMNQTPAPGKQGSSLELLSDPMGVDFRPYLLQILSTVRRNWFAVMPESAHMGRPGKVALQFAIAKNGSVTKVVFATVSGMDAYDKAAVASISMSNPFPPLPVEFRGNVVRLQFTYSYNMRAR